MTFKQLREYISALGGTVDVFTFDCGQRWRIKVGLVTWSNSFECGDEVRFALAVQRWLDGLPWPREDDPRVDVEDTYVN